MRVDVISRSPCRRHGRRPHPMRRTSPCCACKCQARLSSKQAGHQSRHHHGKRWFAPGVGDVAKPMAVAITKKAATVAQVFVRLAFAICNRLPPDDAGTLETVKSGITL